LHIYKYICKLTFISMRLKMAKGVRNWISDWRYGGSLYRVSDLRSACGDSLHRMPYVLRILLENALREPALRRRGKPVRISWPGSTGVPAIMKSFFVRGDC
jgi:hypothetical protein